MPEWSIGAVSKTVVLLVGTGGSNPPLSATEKLESEGLRLFLSSARKLAFKGEGDKKACAAGLIHLLHNNSPQNFVMMKIFIYFMSVLLPS